MKTVFLIISIVWTFQLTGGKSTPEFYRNLDLINIAQNVPDNATYNILVISNRYFDAEDNYTYARYVHPQKKMFFFVVSLTADSSYITAYNSQEEAMRVFPTDRNFLVFVNGHGKNFGQIIGRGFEIAIRYHVNMIMFDWPTDYYALRKTARNARKVTENFTTTIRDLEPILKKDFPASNVSVIFHSMGNHIARRLVQKEYIDFISEGFFNNLILNAPAVKQKHHSEWVNQLNIQKRIYIVTNKNDRPLKGVMILRLARQLGSVYDEPLARNAYYVDFSNIANKEHNIFLGRTDLEKKYPNIAVFYNTLFQGHEPMLTNNPFYLANKHQIDFPGL